MYIEWIKQCSVDRARTINEMQAIEARKRAEAKNKTLNIKFKIRLKQSNQW